MHSPPPPTTRGPEARANEPVLLGAGLFAAVLFSPSLLDVVLLVNLALLVGVGLLHLGAASLARGRADAGGVRPARRWTREPRVSVHVPVAQESPEQVARTLDALRRLEWSAYEVIVVGGAGDLSRWRPIERLCSRLGPRFRARYRPRATSQRAALLDLCLEEADPRAELVLVVEPGMRVHPKLLARAARYFDAPGVSHVQFASAASTGGPAGVREDRASYARVFVSAGELAEAPLPSGTPCLVQRRALALVGGWRRGGHDGMADVGVRFLEAGFEGRFAPEVSARTTLPRSLAALRAQRRAHVFASASTLFHLDVKALRALGAWRSLAVVTQLTAWFDFLLLPALTLPLLAFVPGATREHEVALLAASAAFPLHLALRGALSVLTPRAPDEELAPVRGLLVRLGLLWEGSTAWLEALFGVRLAPQGGGGGRAGSAPRAGRAWSSGTVRDAIAPLLVAVGLAVSAGGLLHRGQLGAALACLLAGGMFGAVLYVQRELSETTRLRRPAPLAAGERSHVLEGATVGGSARPRLDAPRFEPRPELEPRARWHLPDEAERPRALRDPPDLRAPRSG